jgi:FMN reductase
LLEHVGDKLALLRPPRNPLEARDLPHALLHADCGDPASSALLAQSPAADAIVIATPVYKAAYSRLC